MPVTCARGGDGRRARAAAGGALLLAALASDARAEDAKVASPAEPAEGTAVESVVRPREAAKPACSFRRPICVHGEAGRGEEGAALAVLAATERAWDALTGALDLPAPDPDLDTRRFDVYLAAGDLDATAFLGTRDPRSRLDRASAFVVVDPRLAAFPCALDAAVTRAVARAALDRASPGTDRASARAEAAYLARLVVPCAAGAMDDVDVYQRHPDRAVSDPWLLAGPTAGARFDEGAQLFFWWVDSAYARVPAGIVRAMWALSPTKTPLDSARWRGTPDGFTVLAASFKDRLTSGSTIADLFAEFGATRALVGSHENGAEIPEARALGDAIVPPVDWTIDWPTTPRRLAPVAGIAPTGSSYVLVRHAGAAPGARLRLEATWEERAAIRWTVVKLDAAGREKGRVTIPAQARETSVQGTVADVDDVDSLLVVGTNVGDPFAPYDPDDETFEPHGWLLTLGVE